MPKVENKIGLEAEFFLRDGSKRNSQLVYPAPYGFGHDDFPLLGEVRAEPGSTVGETVGNFTKVWLNTLERAEKLGLTVCIPGYVMLSTEQFTDAIRFVGTKVVPETKNIYGTDILGCSDDVVEDGKVVGHYASNGLHVHFSSLATITKSVDSYTPKTFQIEVPGGHHTLTLYEKAEARTTTEIIGRMTMPDLMMIVKSFDENIFPNYNVGPKVTTLKYRQRGFYELKDYGFEYRSLPFTSKVYNELAKIVSYGFSLLKKLDLT